MSKPQDKDEVQ